MDRVSELPGQAQDLVGPVDVAGRLLHQHGGQPGQVDAQLRAVFQVVVLGVLGPRRRRRSVAPVRRHDRQQGGGYALLVAGAEVERQLLGDPARLLGAVEVAPQVRHEALDGAVLDEPRHVPARLQLGPPTGQLRPGAFEISRV